MKRQHIFVFLIVSLISMVSGFVIIQKVDPSIGIGVVAIGAFSFGFMTGAIFNHTSKQ